MKIHEQELIKTMLYFNEISILIIKKNIKCIYFDKISSANHFTVLTIISKLIIVIKRNSEAFLLFFIFGEKKPY